MGYQQLNFRELKSRVGIDDVAFSLGYKVDRRAGLGRFVELVLPDGQGGKRDTIVISHPGEKGRQTYFRRTDGQCKDVISFIMENKNAFHISGRSDWETVAKVLAKFANEPLPQTEQSELINQAWHTERKFNPDKYTVEPVSDNMKAAMYIFKQRNISESTVRDFSPWLDRIRINANGSKFFNIGFPYRQPGSDKVEGYEIRGLSGFKSKATGTNSSTAAWIVDFTKDRNPQEVRNVYFAESAFDIMALYQANKQKLLNEGKLDNSVFVSIGGTFSRNQISGIMEHYKNARAVDCFDNDLPGRIYGIRMVDTMEKLGLGVLQQGDKGCISYNGKDHEFDAAKVNLDSLRGFVKLKRDYGIGKAPSDFKDWNDVIMNKPMEMKLTPNKYTRNDNLEEKRGAGFKM